MSTKKEANKEKIKQAAYRCVAKYGFDKTTLDDIAKEVGLNKASLYYYYKNKEDIFLDITTAATRQAVEGLIAGTLAVEGGIEAQVRYFLVERSAYYVRLAAEIHISEEALRQVEHLFIEQIRDVHQQEHRFLSERLTEAMKNGHLRQVDAPMLAHHLIVLSEGIKRAIKEKHPNATDVKPLVAEIAQQLDFILGVMFAGVRA